MAKKSFFRERTPVEIKALNPKQILNPHGLVERIDDLNPSSEAIEIRTRLLPGRFYFGTQKQIEGSRKCSKHGAFLALANPKTQWECDSCHKIPLEMRARAFEKLRNMREENINFVGYSTQVSFGDRKKRVFPFCIMPEGARIFAYSEQYEPGIVVQPYADAKRVEREGASVVVEVPSREEKLGRYKFKLIHVPVLRSNENLASVLQLRKAVIVDEETEEPLKGTTLHEDYNIKYTYEKDPEASEVVTSYPHDVAAYIAIIKHFNAKHNLTPIEMNPFALPSKHQVEFYKKLCNNVLVYDPTLTSKDKLRALHLAEKSVLLARAIGKYGNDDFAFWDGPRDGRLRDYDWSIEGGK